MPANKAAAKNSMLANKATAQNSMLANKLSPKTKRNIFVSKIIHFYIGKNGERYEEGIC